MQGDSFRGFQLRGDYDYLAPDGSEIRLLPKANAGGLCHCTLPGGKTSSAVRHKSVEEIWYVLGGEGEMWMELNDQEEVIRLRGGLSLVIPPGTRFQFRAKGPESLRILIATMPPWPGPDEAVLVSGFWK